MKPTTILLLISDQLVRSVFQETLEHEGYLVLSTGDLGSAVTQLRQGEPDLLITRTYVSNMTGHEAAKYLRTKRPGLRVLIVEAACWPTTACNTAIRSSILRSSPSPTPPPNSWPK